MSGFFGIGIEKVSKQGNMGNLVRSAHAFGASFAFTIGSGLTRGDVFSDTSKSVQQLPYYAWGGIDELQLPKHCKLVGVELVEDAIDLPSFRHPAQAAYVLGQERGSVSADVLERCSYVIKIPTAFCINVATAGAIVMYDRIRSRGRFPERPVAAGGPTELLPEPVFGAPRMRTK